MIIKNIKLTLLLLSALLLASTVHANLDDLNLFHQTEDTQDSLVWPMLPDESLASLAVKFYPKNKAMQRKFIVKTKLLNKDSQIVEDPNYRVGALTAITIPNLQSLSVSAGAIKRSPRKTNNKDLQLSYNIKTAAEKAKATFQNIPARLIEEYEELVARNTFLKEEIAKLNERLVFLQNKLGELKLILDKTLTLPAKKSFKNLDTEKAQVESKQNKAQHKSIIVAPKVEQKEEPSFFDLSNKLLWLGLILFGLLLIVSSYLYKKYQEKKYLKLVNAISQQNQATTFNIATKSESQKDALLPTTTLNKDTVVGEQNDETILREAKTLVAQNAADEAIEHLKWAIKAQPKTTINIWLYLLDIFRQQDLKDEFEKYALEMHQNFNVMTPLWEERAVAMVVSQSLEEFPYIMKLLTDKWPNVKIISYLQKLISDNRSGERSGFSKAVVEEILLLIDVLKVRAED